MRWLTTFCFILAAATAWPGQAHVDDEAAQFVSDVETCQSNYKDVPPDARPDCLLGTALTYTYSGYRRAAWQRLFNGFEDDYPTFGEGEGFWKLIAAVKHWKDYAVPGPDAREYMLRLVKPGAGTAPRLVARLIRARGEAVEIQISRFLDRRFDPKRDLEPFKRLRPAEFYAEFKKRLPSVEAFMEDLAIEELTAEAATCSALKEVVTQLSNIDVPLPEQMRPPQKYGASDVERITLHPHIVVLRAPSYPITLTIEDASMNTDVYRWASSSAERLEPCWRRVVEQQLPSARP
jgi:hypothetical protein